MTIYYHSYENGIFSYNSDLSVDDAFEFFGKGNIAELLYYTVKTGTFTGIDGKIYKISDNPEKFFTEYIPRVFGFKADLKKAKDQKEFDSIVKNKIKDLK